MNDKWSTTPDPLDPALVVGDVYSFAIQVACARCKAPAGQDCDRKRRNQTEQYNAILDRGGVKDWRGREPVDPNDTLHAPRYDAGRRRQTKDFLAAMRDRLHCPACPKEVVYLRTLDLYVHTDRSDNRECWLAVTRRDAYLDPHRKTA